MLRDGGNVASHFDEGREITEEIASETLDLLEAFIEYLVLLPARTHRLTELLEQETAERSTPQTDESVEGH